MITIKSAEEIGKMRRAGALLHQVLEELRAMIVPGVTTNDIDRMAEKLIRGGGAIPSSKGYEGFPASICASLNDQVVHGFPNDKPLNEGDLISIDCTLVLDDWQADSAFSVVVGGHGDPQAEKLVRVTEECFWKGLEQVHEGNRLGDVSHAVQEHAEKNGFSVIRDYCGHGIGREMHEDPSVPNYGRPGRGVRLKPGMVFTIEPMIAMKNWPIYIDTNGWTAITRDHGWCSHHEHTVVVTTGDPEILTLPGARV